jgi:hypothetical protein
MIQTHPYRAGVLLLLLAAPIFAADPPDFSDKRRLTFGIHLQVYPLKMFDTKSTTSSSTKPLADYSYSATTDSPMVGFGPALEYRITDHISAGVEMLFHRTQYKQVTETRTGKKDTSATTDSRPLATLTETTRSNTWEVPLLARYYGIRQRGIFSRLYVLGGGSFRHTANIRTANEISNADGSTDYNEIPTRAAKANQIGVVGGFGIRFIDNFGIRIAPEVRITRWNGFAFQGQSVTSVRNDIQGGIGITF